MATAGFDTSAGRRLLQALVLMTVMIVDSEFVDSICWRSPASSGTGSEPISASASWPHSWVEPASATPTTL